SGPIELWNVDSGVGKVIYDPRGQRIDKQIDILPKPDRLVCTEFAGRDAVVKIIDVATGKAEASFPTQSASAMCHTSDGYLLFRLERITWDLKADSCWVNTRKGLPVKQFAGFHFPAGFSGDGSRFFAFRRGEGPREFAVAFFDVPSGI